MQKDKYELTHFVIFVGVRKKLKIPPFSGKTLLQISRVLCQSGKTVTLQTATS